MSAATTEVLEFEVLDVFTRTPFHGNPLAVALGAEDLSTDQMQALAAEFALVPTGSRGPGSPSATSTCGPMRLPAWTSILGPCGSCRPGGPRDRSAALGPEVQAERDGPLPGEGRSEVTVTQGVEMGRPATLRVSVDAEGGVARAARVCGDVVRVSPGWIAVSRAECQWADGQWADGQWLSASGLSASGLSASGLSARVPLQAPGSGRP
jgi:hypothetical protein